MGSTYLKYRPNKIIDGDNKYNLIKKNIPKYGLESIIEIINKSEDMSSKYTISSFEIGINNNGLIDNFTLSLNCYDSDLNYTGNAFYNYSTGNLKYVKPYENNVDLIIEYDKNSEIEYLSRQIKKIPLVKQIRLGDFNSYLLKYKMGTKIDKDSPIFDFRNNKSVEALTPEDYKSGKGGKSDGKYAVVIELSNGLSIPNEEKYSYVFDKINKDDPINPNSMMEVDYYINNGTLKFTRNYGESYIDTDITEEELNETLSFYRNGQKLKTNSWFLSNNEKLPIAFFYGENPILKISNDNGKTYREIKFDGIDSIEKSITRRIVGFSNEKFGYAALGTDWSMGSGEYKKIYFTYDSGYTWKEIEVPFTNSSSTLIDMCMYDENNGIMILSNNEDINFPIIYATVDGGLNFNKVDIDYSQLPNSVTYFVDVDNIKYEDGSYKIMLGQQDLGTLKIIFKTDKLNNKWIFDSTTNMNIHTVG